MAVSLSVREIHEALYRAGGGRDGAGAGEPSTALLGTIFHEVFAALIGPDPRVNLDAAWKQTDGDAEARRATLLQHVYDRLVGPRLRREQAHLHHVSAQVLTFWRAIEALCDWLIGLKGTGGLVATVEPLAQEWRDPSWSDAVRLVGVPDAIVRLPGSGRWCIVELKLGRTAPEADLGQMCLYHQLLSTELNTDPGAIALVSFEPERQERLF